MSWLPDGLIENFPATIEEAFGLPRTLQEWRQKILGLHKQVLREHAADCGVDDDTLCDAVIVFIIFKRPHLLTGEDATAVVESGKRVISEVVVQLKKHFKFDEPFAWSDFEAQLTNRRAI